MHDDLLDEPPLAGDACPCRTIPDEAIRPFREAVATLEGANRRRQALQGGVGTDAVRVAPFEEMAWRLRALKATCERLASAAEVWNSQAVFANLAHHLESISRTEDTLAAARSWVHGADLPALLHDMERLCRRLGRVWTIPQPQPLFAQLAGALGTAIAYCQCTVAPELHTGQDDASLSV